MSAVRGYEVSFKILPLSHMFRLPAKQADDDAGYDIYCCSRGEIGPGERALLPAGFCLGVPPGYEAQVRPRSGLALKDGITVLNSPGTIDAGYTGEVGVLLINHGTKAWQYAPGMRIAQLVFARLPNVSLKTVLKLDQSKRGAGGFGSTGR